MELRYYIAMKILSNLFTRFLNRPLNCPEPPANVKDTKTYYSQWESQNQNSGFGHEKIGTYLGIGQTIFGVLIAGYGFIKGSKIAKYAGISLAVIGALVTTVGKFIGFDFRDPVNGAMNGNTRRVQKKPEDFEVKNASEVKITSGDGNMQGYFIPAKKETKKTIIHIHGVRNNIGDCLPEIKQLQERMNVNVLIVDPRGFGNSSYTSISSKSLTEDALAMYDYLVEQKKIPQSDISVFGHSLGAQAAIELATRKQVDVLISQSTFSTSENIANQYMESIYGGSILNYVAKGKIHGAIKERFDFHAEESLKKVKANTVILSHAGKDEWVPCNKNLGLLEKALSQNDEVKNKETIIQEGAKHKNHAEHYDKSGFYDVLARYMGVERFHEESSVQIQTPSSFPSDMKPSPGWIPV